VEIVIVVGVQIVAVVVEIVIVVGVQIVVVVAAD